MKLPLLAIACLTRLTLTSYAQTGPVFQWHHLDPLTDNLIGISTDRAYELLKTLPGYDRAKPNKPLIIAVADRGVDANHEDLKSVIWTNPNEIAGNGKDDDGNGYVDDVHGWNFMGLPDGHTLLNGQTEVTRLYARLQPLYEGKTAQALTKTPLSPQQHELALWKVVKPYFESRRVEALRRYQRDSLLLAEDQAALVQMQQGFGVSRIDTALLHHPPTRDTSLLKLARLYYRDMVRRRTATYQEYLQSHQLAHRGMERPVRYGYNLGYNPPLPDARPTDMTERHYGNADATGDYSEDGTFHGTFIAGIIGADRTNQLGVKGIADQVKILSVVAGTAGDERDKDVANSIRYAVDNGASIINMSFGKYFSPHRALVEEAIHYAEQKGVLLIHAAGNNHLDLDSALHYPYPRYLSGALISNLITVGASGRTNDSTLATSFSNYGQQTVDVFAPGVELESTTPQNTYGSTNGTSVATPVVVGVAAVLKTYFPDLSPADLKRIILQSAVVYHTPVLKPGTRQTVDFASLSKSGGVVNLYEAVKLAMREASVKKRLPSRKD